jgi:hypothetical protein
MTQEATPVGGEATPVEPTKDYFTDLAEQEFGVTDEQEEEPAEAPEGEEAADDTDIEEEADDLPPIDPPVSLTAEEKEAFKNLPREAQEFTARRIGELEKGFNTKAQEAAQARQTAISQATAELAQIEQGYAQHFQQLAEQLQPQRPNPQLLQVDPAAFYAQQANYENTIAQQRELQQRSQEFAQQAQARAQQIAQAEQAEQTRIIVEQFPEYADPTTGPALRQKLSAVAKRLGYPDELIGQARATDILAMREVASALEKADKYDALMAKKMEKVRAAKGLPKVATPGVAQGSEQLRAKSAQAAFEIAKTAKNRDQAGAAFHEFLQKSGHI